jgi:predicted RNase H-like HicB family nuclease
VRPDWSTFDEPGVVAVGESREQVAARIQEALSAFAEEMRAQGRPLPVPLSAAGTARL